MRPSSSEATERAYTQRFTVRFQLCRDVTLRFTPLSGVYSVVCLDLEVRYGGMGGAYPVNITHRSGGEGGCECVSLSILLSYLLTLYLRRSRGGK